MQNGVEFQSGVEWSVGSVELGLIKVLDLVL